MKKVMSWGFILFTSLVMFSACEDGPSAVSHGWINSTWKYDSKEIDDRITLGGESLTYNSFRAGGKKTLSITIVGKQTASLENETKNSVTDEERILAWILDPDKGESVIYGIIYCPIKVTKRDPKTGTATAWEELTPHKIKILAPEIYSYLNPKIKFDFIYIEQ
jgi:hypothetical protein